MAKSVLNLTQFYDPIITRLKCDIDSDAKFLLSQIHVKLNFQRLQPRPVTLSMRPKLSVNNCNSKAVYQNYKLDFWLTKVSRSRVQPKNKVELFKQERINLKNLHQYTVHQLFSLFFFQDGSILSPQNVLNLHHQQWLK